MTQDQPWRFSLPLPAEIATTAGPPDLDASWNPMSDAPFNMIETITLTPTRPPARLGWDSLDTCPVCHAERGQACRHMGYPADSGRTVQRAHRGRQQYVSPGYALFLANKFGPSRALDPWLPAMAGSLLTFRALTSHRLADTIAGVASGFLRSLDLMITVSKPRRSARLRRMHTIYPHRRRPRR